MSNATELLVLRLALIGIIFVFVFGVAMTMRGGLRVRAAGAARRAAVRGTRLVVLVPGQTGLESGDELPVAGEMTIGRDPGNGIVLADPSVSAFHGLIVPFQGGWRLTDTGSTNGTFVNGHAIDGKGAVLRGDEEITFGKVVTRLQR